MRVIAVILEPRAPCGILEVSCSCVSPQEQDSSQSPERIAHEQPRRGADRVRSQEVQLSERDAAEQSALAPGRATRMRSLLRDGYELGRGTLESVSRHPRVRPAAGAEIPVTAMAASLAYASVDIGLPIERCHFTRHRAQH